MDLPHVTGDRLLPGEAHALLAPDPWPLELLAGAGRQVPLVHIPLALGAEDTHGLVRLQPPLGMEALVADFASELKEK